MTKEEALKLALAALERVSTVDDECDIFAPPLSNAVVNAIIAIKEALAQPVQKPFTYYDPVRDAIRPFPVDGDIPLYTTHNIGDKS